MSVVAAAVAAAAATTVNAATVVAEMTVAAGSVTEVIKTELEECILRKDLLELFELGCFDQ